MPRKKKEVEAPKALTGAEEYLKMFAQSHRIGVLDPGTIEMFKRAGFKMRIKPVTAPQFGNDPIGFLVEVQIGRFIERA